MNLFPKKNKEYKIEYRNKTCMKIHKIQMMMGTRQKQTSFNKFNIMEVKSDLPELLYSPCR